MADTQTKTDLREFPETMHHLVLHAIEGENRKLYGIGRGGRKWQDQTTAQVRILPYKITGFRAVPAGGAPGSVTIITFKNEGTRKSDETSLWDATEIHDGLEEKLGVKAPHGEDIDLRTYNRWLKANFTSVDVIGAAIETYQDGKKDYRLFGIFID